jgi:hypothetical protein
MDPRIARFLGFGARAGLLLSAAMKRPCWAGLACASALASLECLLGGRRGLGHDHASVPPDHGQGFRGRRGHGHHGGAARRGAARHEEHARGHRRGVCLVCGAFARPRARRTSAPAIAGASSPSLPRGPAARNCSPRSTLPGSRPWPCARRQFAGRLDPRRTHLRHRRQDRQKQRLRQAWHRARVGHRARCRARHDLRRHRRRREDLRHRCQGRMRACSGIRATST